MIDVSELEQYMTDYLSENDGDSTIARVFNDFCDYLVRRNKDAESN